MKEKPINKKMIKRFEVKLAEDEKSTATIKKYIRDVNAFLEFLLNKQLTKQVVIEYKRQISDKYAPASVNSMLVSINSFLTFIHKENCKVKLKKIQHQSFANEEKMLTASEYRKLLHAAGDTRLGLVIRTICETGIRVSELSFITFDAVKRGRAVVECKNKTRVILIPSTLRTELLKYIKKSGIKTGCVFVTKAGNPLNRSNIWRDMKLLCKKTDVQAGKVFPHNLRHLFARTFYKIERDIVRLADVLGHSSINTTRIYTLESGIEHYNCLERMNKALIT